MMRLLACGSRHFDCCSTVARGIESFDPRPVVIIQGGAKGADMLAFNFAQSVGIPTEDYPADWSLGRSAGIRRNADMLRLGKPDHGLAFGALWKRDTFPPKFDAPGVHVPKWKHTGTGDMVKRMLAAGIPVRWVPGPGEPAQDLTTMPAPPVAT
jgi:hypothetical protein